MKKLSCILLAVMLITALFVSCTAEVIDPYDGLAYVTFGGPASKDLSASYEVQSYEDLFWFYTAQKDDDFGKTGETSDETPLAGTAETPAKGLGGKIGPFSQGTWKFELFAYSNSEKADGTLVYKGSVEGIKLTSSSLTSVPVSVTPQGETGTIEFRGAYFKWAGDSGNGKPNIKITVSKEDGTEAYVLRSDIPEDSGNQIVLHMGDKVEGGKFSIDQIYGKVDAGYYKCDVEAWFVVDETTYTIFKSEKSFGIRVYGSAKTVVSGDITEAVDSEIIFTPNTNLPNLSVFKGLSQISVDATPSNSEDQKTTIDFGANLEADKTYSLQVATSDTLAAAEKFVVTSEQAAVAGIDLTLTTDNIPVTSFGSDITITTYISTGLSGVKVLYGNDGKDYLKSYNSSTGELIFATNHFSEFYVVSDAVASIGDTGYAFLQDAVDCARNGEKIKLLNDVDITTSLGLSIDKKITLDLNGKSIKAGERMTTNIKVYSSGSLALEDSSSEGNGRIYTEDAHVNVDNGYGIICVFGVFIMDSGKVEAVIESDPQNKGQFGICVGTNGKVTINGGEIKAGWYAVSNNANDSGSEITVNGGTLISTADYAIYNPGKSSSLTINGGTIYGAAGGIDMAQGKLSVRGGIITSKDNGDTGEWGDGTGNTSNAALYIGKESGGYGDVYAVIEGGSFIAEGDADVLKLPEKTAFNIKLELKGGTFSSEPSSEYVVDGYVSERTPENKYIVRQVKDSDVATISGTIYQSLSDAIENAKNGEVIRLLRDVELAEFVTIDKNIEINLNGKDIKSMTDFAIFAKGGRTKLSGKGVVSVHDGATDTSSVVYISGASFSIGKDVVVSSDCCYGIVAVSSAELVVDGMVKTKKVPAISGNGTQGLGGTRIEINGMVTTEEVNAIYHPQSGNLVVNGTVKGNGGIEMKAGKLFLSTDCEVEATATEQSHVPCDNGCSTSGYAIALVDNNGYAGPAEIAENNGTITGIIATDLKD